MPRVKELFERLEVLGKEGVFPLEQQELEDLQKEAEHFCNWVIKQGVEEMTGSRAIYYIRGYSDAIYRLNECYRKLKDIVEKRNHS